MRLSSDLWTSFWCSHSPPQSGSCEIVHQACWTGRKNQSRLPAQLNLPILVGTVDLHRPSGAAQLHAAAAPSGYLFESPSQTRLCIVALLTKLPEDTRTLDLAAKGLYGPLDTVAFFDLDFTHTALLCFQSSTDKPKKKTGRRARSYLTVLPAPLSGARRPRILLRQGLCVKRHAHLHGQPPAPPVRRISHRPQPKAATVTDAKT